MNLIKSIDRNPYWRELLLAVWGGQDLSVCLRVGELDRGSEQALHAASSEAAEVFLADHDELFGRAISKSKAVFVEKKYGVVSGIKNDGHAIIGEGNRSFVQVTLATSGTGKVIDLEPIAQAKKGIDEEVSEKGGEVKEEIHQTSSGLV